jgi:4-methyl-5(b-hydroxyethyl)-thiazole monophosphate biosynthesis
MAKKALVLLIDGFEEVEAITCVDYLRRAKVEVTVAGVGGTRIKGSHGVVVLADAELASPCPLHDAIVIPGGPGSRELIKHQAVVDAVKAHEKAGKIVAAICAAPVVVVSSLALLKGRKFTCFPGMEGEARGGAFSPERVVRDGALITSRAAGTTGEFALAIVEALEGAQAAAALAESVLLKA